MAVFYLTAWSPENFVQHCIYYFRSRFACIGTYSDCIGTVIDEVPIGILLKMGEGRAVRLMADSRFLFTKETMDTMLRCSESLLGANAVH